tara:strand:- start:37 stop:372 length:336 start_codon:yes stop_codon:yes gene_type:complete
MQFEKAFRWTPRVLSFLLLIIWITTIVILFNFDKNFMIFLMAWVMLVLASAISLREEFIGGLIWLILAVVIILAGYRKLISSYVSIPLFIIGILYLAHYVYRSKVGGADDF